MSELVGFLWAANFKRRKRQSECLRQCSSSPKDGDIIACMYYRVVYLTGSVISLSANKKNCFFSISYCNKYT